MAMKVRPWGSWVIESASEGNITHKFRPPDRPWVFQFQHEVTVVCLVYHICPRPVLPNLHPSSAWHVPEGDEFDPSLDTKRRNRTFLIQTLLFGAPKVLPWSKSTLCIGLLTKSPIKGRPILLSTGWRSGTS